MNAAQTGKRLNAWVRPAISITADKVRQQIGRVDNPEVRKARQLAHLARRSAVDVLCLGDSMMSFVATYDTDKRPLHRMMKDSFGPSTTVHAIHGGSYNPLIYNQFIRMLEKHSARPLVVLPLTARVRTLPWIEHPVHGHQRASRFLTGIDSTTPLRKIRTGIPRPTPEDFARFHALRHPTWAGDLTIGDYVHPLKRRGLDEKDAARLLYAYHHGGEVVPGPPLDIVCELGERLRRLGLPVVVYQEPVPVQKGVELHGPMFHDLAERNLAVLEDAFVAGYGPVPVLRTGLTVPTAHFIDWRDGTEHVNEKGRSTIASAVVDAANSLRS